MKTAFGLDPSGYSGSNSGFTRADLGSDGLLQVTVYENHVFRRTLRSSDPLEKHVESEKKVLKCCLGAGSVLVDIPIDLQGLPCPADAYFTWVLVKRPVDYAFDALAPLANLIGSPVARFQHMLRALREEAPDENLHEVLETYPAATLELLGLWCTGYGKQQARFTRGRWEGGPMARIANTLRMVADEGETLTGDEFDAAICAITGLVAPDKRLAGDELADKVREKIKARVAIQHHERISAIVPDNYVLMRSTPDTEIRIVRELMDDPEKILDR